MAISALRQEETVTDSHQLNAPLTLGELRKMDGEPVWIKLFDPDEAFWVLRNEWVDTRNPEPMILFHMRWYSHADYGKTWLAYRQKPEEPVTDSHQMTNADRINAMSIEEKADFLSEIAYGRETPWSEPFARKLCDNCPTVHGTYESGVEDDFHECDFVDGKCPHGSDIVWWLQQPAEEDAHA